MSTPYWPATSAMRLPMPGSSMSRPMMNEPTTRMLCRWIRRTEARKSRPLSRLNFLPISRSPSGVGDSKPMKTPRHPALAASVSSSSSSAKLMVAWAIHSCPGCPDHGAEQVLGAGDVLGADADEVVVHHQHPFLADRLEFPHDVRDGPLAVVGAVERRHAAEAAVQRAAARGLDGAEGIARRQQIMPGRRHIGHFGEPSVIPAFQAAVPGVVQDLRPDALGFAGDNRVHVLQGLVQAHGGVNAAHDDRHAPAPELGGHLIGAVGLRREGGNAHQVRPRHGRVVRHAEVLVDDRDFPLRRRQARQDHQAQRLPDAIAVPAALLDVDEAHKRVEGLIR